MNKASKKYQLSIFFLTNFLILFCILAKGQTFFETAKDDGIIAFSNKSISQIKVNLSSTAITYGYYYIGGNSVDKNRILINGEIKVKPNDNGIASLVKEGNLQPGIKGSFAFGYRLNENPFFKHNWGVLDFYLRGEFNYNAYTIFDSTRLENSLEPLYNKNKSSVALNVSLNYATSIGKTNLFFGGQFGLFWSNNVNDLEMASIQTIQNYPNSSTQFVVSNIESARIGQLKKQTKAPLKFDLIFDPGLNLNNVDTTNLRLGVFSYYRTDIKIDHIKQRFGFGLCLLDAQNPSRIFSSMGYELPKFGSSVTNIEREKDKGIVFASIGYSIF